MMRNRENRKLQRSRKSRDDSLRSDNVSTGGWIQSLSCWNLVGIGLDYSTGCVDFSDVGKSLHLITNEFLNATSTRSRGEKIDFVENLDEIGNPATVLYLRIRPDTQHHPICIAHLSASNDLEKYDRRQWVLERSMPNCVVCKNNGDVDDVPECTHSFRCTIATKTIWDMLLLR